MAFHHKILGIVTLLYLFLFLMHIIYFAVKKDKIVTFIWLVLYGTFGLHTVGLILRWIESYNFLEGFFKKDFSFVGLILSWVESYNLGIGHAPLSNFYESLVFYSWCISLILVVMKKRLNYPAITTLCALISLFLMGYASISPSVDRNIQPLVPALQSNWLHIHVFTCFLAYASFVVSFVCGLLYMFTWKSVIPPRETLDEINYRSVIVGFYMLSAGIFTGAVWAHYAWGSYWSWDPKETWSLITWIIYAVFLHARSVRGWKGKKIAILSIIGFASVIFTYFGVNFVLSGLHSYAT